MLGVFLLEREAQHYADIGVNRSGEHKHSSTRRWPLDPESLEPRETTHKRGGGRRSREDARRLWRPYLKDLTMPSPR